jgi:hypothetical protein
MREFGSLSSDRLDHVCGGMNGQLFRAMQKAVDLGCNVHWVNTGPHYPNSRHWQGRAFDVGGDASARQAFFNWAKGTRPHELIYQHTFLKDGRRVHPIGGHDDHVHYSV